MNIDTAFPSRWLKALDIKGKRIPVTLANVAEEEVGDGVKPVLYFEGKEKGLVLNKTNAEILKDAYGPETDDWAGQKAILGTHKVRGRDGNLVDGITVAVPVAEAAPDDAIPF
jgi:hypothetical protein